MINSNKIIIQKAKRGKAGVQQRRGKRKRSLVLQEGRIEEEKVEEEKVKEASEEGDEEDERRKSSELQSYTQMWSAREDEYEEYEEKRGT